jgi:Gluconate 2-dehydrogenase subunit 3
MNSETSTTESALAAPGISRRESLKWLGLMLAGNLVATVPARAYAPTVGDSGGTGHWPALKLPALKASGYGQDPDLMTLETGPWPKTLSAADLAIVSILAGILVPREGSVPSAAELEVQHVVDEWISAPYEAQQQDRLPILSLLRWLDDESAMRFDRNFAGIDDAQRLAIVDDIAWLDAATEFKRPADAFHRLRSIIVSAFFCTPEGSKDLGYLGGVAIAGDYPGPSKEALEHLRQALKSLELDEVADPALRG